MNCSSMTIRAIHLLVVLVGQISGFSESGIRAQQFAINSRSEPKMILDRGPWYWTPSTATLPHCLANNCGKYGWVASRVFVQGNLPLRVSLTQTDGKELFSWPAHWNTVFVVDGDTLIYVEFNVASTGGTAVAVDVPAGIEKWRCEIGKCMRGLAPGFANRSERQIGVIKDIAHTYVTIVGCESGGSFVSMIDLNSGELLAEGIKELILRDMPPSCPCQTTPDKASSK